MEWLFLSSPAKNLMKLTEIHEDVVCVGLVEKIRDFLQWFYFFMYSFGWCWCPRNERF